VSRAFPIREFQPFAAAGAPKGKSGRVMDAEFQARQDMVPMVARCAWCPDFVFEGLSGEAREAAAAHRLEPHPEARSSRKRWRTWTATNGQRAA
jgi:hypothetical protein